MVSLYRWLRRRRLANYSSGGLVKGGIPANRRRHGQEGGGTGSRASQPGKPLHASADPVIRTERVNRAGWSGLIGHDPATGQNRRRFGCSRPLAMAETIGAHLGKALTFGARRSTLCADAERRPCFSLAREIAHGR
jgi:hypothetical protein